MILLICCDFTLKMAWSSILKHPSSCMSLFQVKQKRSSIRDPHGHLFLKTPRYYSVCVGDIKSTEGVLERTSWLLFMFCSKECSFLRDFLISLLSFLQSLGATTCFEWHQYTQLRRLQGHSRSFIIKGESDISLPQEQVRFFCYYPYSFRAWILTHKFRVGYNRKLVIQKNLPSHLCWRSCHLSSKESLKKIVIKRHHEIVIRKSSKHFFRKRRPEGNSLQPEPFFLHHHKSCWRSQYCFHHEFR